MTSTKREVTPRKACVVLAATHDYLPQTKAAIAGLRNNANWPFDVCAMLYDEGVGIDTTWLADRNIRFKIVPPIDRTVERRRAVCLIKFCLFDIEFKEWEKIIFLDLDVLVRMPLDGLLTVTGIGAVQGLGLPTVGDRLMVGRGRNTIQLFHEFCSAWDVHAPCLNAGVIAFDTELIGRDTKADLVGLYRKYKPILVNPDEAIIGSYFRRRFTWLPAVYNVNAKRIDRYIIGNRKCLVHCIGARKPWDPKSPYFPEWSRLLDRAESAHAGIQGGIGRRADESLRTDHLIEAYYRYLKLRQRIPGFRLPKG